MLRTKDLRSQDPLVSAFYDSQPALGDPENGNKVKGVNVDMTHILGWRENGSELFWWKF